LLQSINAYIQEVIAIIAANQAFYLATGGAVGGDVNSEPLNMLEVNGTFLQDIPEQGQTRFITLIVYADGEQIFTTDVMTQEPIRMPALQKGYVYEIRISGNTPVQ